MSILLKIASFSISISAVILLFYVISRASSRRFSAVCRYLMWAFVVVRMCLPLSFLPSAVNLSVPVSEPAKTVAEETVTAPTTITTSGPVNLIESSDPVENPPVAISEPAPATPAEPSAFDEPVIREPVDKNTGKTDKPVTVEKQKLKLPDVPTMILIAYLSVASVLLLYRLVGYNVKMHALKKRFREPDERTAAIFREFGDLLNSRVPDIVISPDVAGPFLFGFFKKTIVLPDVSLTDEELRGILRHELVHFRRGDLLMKLAGVVCLSFNFFNPFAYLAVSMMNREMELSCDEILLRDKGETEREKYGRTLLKIVKMGTNMKAEKLTTEFYGSGKTMKRRFSAVMDTKKKKRGIVLISVALIICILSGALISCGVNKQKPVGKDESKTEQQQTPGTDTEQTGEPEEGSLKLNTDLLDEYKMTFAELTAKHGKIVDYTQIEGGNFYRFENGYGYYGFDIPSNTSQLVTDPESGLVYIHVDDEALCRWIDMIEPDSLINGEFETFTIEELSNIDGLDYIGTDPDGIATPKAYCSMFHYHGWDSDKVTLDVYHDDENIIDSTSEIRIYIHPQDIAEETKPKPLYYPETDVHDYDRVCEFAEKDNLYAVLKAFLDGDGKTLYELGAGVGTALNFNKDLGNQLIEAENEFFDSFEISDFSVEETEIPNTSTRLAGGRGLKFTFNVKNSTTLFIADGEHELYIGYDRNSNSKGDPKGWAFIADIGAQQASGYLYESIRSLDPDLESVFKYSIMSYGLLSSDFRNDEELKQSKSIYEGIFFLRKDPFVDGNYAPMTEEEVRQGALELFGIEDFDVNMTIVNYLAAHGGFGPFTQISNFTNNGDRYYLTARTYVDISELIVADEFVITLRKSDGMYSYVIENVEITYSSGLDAGGIST